MGYVQVVREQGLMWIYVNECERERKLPTLELLPFKRRRRRQRHKHMQHIDMTIENVKKSSPPCTSPPLCTSQSTLSHSLFCSLIMMSEEFEGGNKWISSCAFPSFLHSRMRAYERAERKPTRTRENKVS